LDFCRTVLDQAITAVKAEYKERKKELIQAGKEEQAKQIPKEGSDEYDDFVIYTMSRMFVGMNERRKRALELEKANKRRAKEQAKQEAEKRKAEEAERKIWEEGRDTRVNQWREHKQQKHRKKKRKSQDQFDPVTGLLIEKKRKRRRRGMLKPPRLKVEQRD